MPTGVKPALVGILSLEAKFVSLCTLATTTTQAGRTTTPFTPAHRLAHLLPPTHCTSPHSPTTPPLHNQPRTIATDRNPVVTLILAHYYVFWPTTAVVIVLHHRSRQKRHSIASSTREEEASCRRTREWCESRDRPHRNDSESRPRMPSRATKQSRRVKAKTRRERATKTVLRY